MPGTFDDPDGLNFGGASPNPILGQIAAYKQKLGDFNTYANQLADQYGAQNYYKMPDLVARKDALDSEYTTLLDGLNKSGYGQTGALNKYNAGGTANTSGYDAIDPTKDAETLNGFTAPVLGGHNQGNAFTSALKTAVPIGLSLIPGLTPAIGGLFGATGATAGAIGGGLLGAATGAATGGGKGALIGGLTGGLGGYFGNGGLSDLTGGGGLSGLGKSLGLDDLFGSTSLSSQPLDLGSFGGGATDNPFVQAARSGVSDAATAATGNALAGVTNTASGATGGGGTLGGFFKDPIGSIKTMATDAISPTNLLKSGIKYGLADFLSKDNSKGYGAIQNAANENAALYQPYLQSGTAAQNQLANLYGFNGQDAATAAMSQFQTDPGYQFARQQGIDALDASAARRGLLVSGNNQQAVQDFGTNLANQQYGNYLARLTGLANTGLTAADDTGSSNIYGASAQAAASKLKADNSNNLLYRALGLI
ncbi:hypothetical protein [Limnoglobus roseus]|uniref:Uncharacterized protein n=1 Tax=Limnoglobus roseus TaxID=2598579 RepID=A0A5C1ANM1_9BACT|nr:hypothetical protein [Limnoglobus roseus]QEL19342.1 hypothetical protein PX52LOC_06411 [Limnoglobus roseus]